MGLTKKQQLFVQEFAKDPACGKAEAARRAGYKRNRAAITACELLKNPEIQTEIERNLSKKFDQSELNTDTVKKWLVDIYEAATAAGSGSWQMTARLKAAELLGKHLKMFSDRVEVGLDDALMEKLLDGRKRAGVVDAHELKADIIRAKLPELPA